MEPHKTLAGRAWAPGITGVQDGMFHRAELGLHLPLQGICEALERIQAWGTKPAPSAEGYHWGGLRGTEQKMHTSLQRVPSSLAVPEALVPHLPLQALGRPARTARQALRDLLLPAPVSLQDGVSQSTLCQRLSRFPDPPNPGLGGKPAHEV